MRLAKNGDLMGDSRSIAIETSCRAGSIALGLGSTQVAALSFGAELEHARDLVPAAQRLVRDQGWSPNELDQCFVSIGPGSFTGIRVGVAFARHLALATRARLCAVGTLWAIATNCLSMDEPPDRLAVILDAKRGQVYAAVFERVNEGYRCEVDAHVCDPLAFFQRPPRPAAVVGEGIERHREVVEASGVEAIDRSLWMPHASIVLKLGLGLAAQGVFVSPDLLVPAYIRRPEAEELWEKRHGIKSKESNKPPGLEAASDGTPSE